MNGYIGYVAFLDVIGFGNMIKTKPIEQIASKMECALRMNKMAIKLGGHPDLDSTADLKWENTPLDCFSFSDTFVLSTRDIKENDLFQILAGTAVLTQYLIVGGLAPRGGISKGQLLKISNTDHLIGNGIIKAAELEKQQDWFGVAIDPEIVTNEFLELCNNPLLDPLVVNYPVPMKVEYKGPLVNWAINWRYNLKSENGFKSLFPTPNSLHDKKLENTMQYSKYLWMNNMDQGSIMDAEDKQLITNWKRGMWIGTKPPDHPDSIHVEDDY